ncbi:MAG: DNA topoisomerase VI subunit B, partial [Candidatus Thorarchaeota archaeon]|nr:DNA topoisomerase VI subunit B [Candidatus Thorarchaeota archaeon]
TKFTHRQSRGTFGLGGSLALLYGQVTTQKPIEIITGIQGEEFFHSIQMKLDIDRNEPEIIQEERFPKEKEDHGTTISFHLQGDWLRSKKRILDYFNQTSVIVPYSSIWFQTPEGELLEHERVIDVLPKPPKEVKPHPSGIDVELLKSMISTTRYKNIKSFLMKTFQRIGPSTADGFLLYASLDPEVNPKSLSDEVLLDMMNALAEFNGFMAPTSNALSPAGSTAMHVGMKRLNPELLVTTERAPSVHEGHPFIIEAGVAYGGELPAGTNLFRFANRIPLLYDEGSDVSTRVIRGLNLKPYGFRSEDPLAFFVHLCSTKVPYKTVGKEYIADVDAVRREIDLGLKDCLRRLGEQVRKRNRVHKKTKRESRLRNYYQFIASTLEEATCQKVGLENLMKSEEE